MEHGESRSHCKIDQTTVSLWPSERPIPEPIGPPWATHPWLNHSVSDPLLDRSATFRSTHHVHVATTVATTKSPINWSLSLSQLVLWWFFYLFLFLCVYIFWFSVIIFFWILGKCEKHDKNVFSRAFWGIQPNTIKYFLKYFLECYQTPENVFISKKYFHTRKYFLKYFLKCN